MWNKKSLIPRISNTHHPDDSILSVMTLVDEGSESQVLGLGFSVIVLNLVIYVAAPAIVGFVVTKHFESRK